MDKSGRADDPGEGEKTHGKHSVGFVGGRKVVWMWAGLVDSVPGQVCQRRRESVVNQPI